MVKTEQHREVTLERRTEPRIKAGLSVILKTPNALPMEACLLDLSSSGARLRVPEAMLAGEEVRIEAQDLLLLGTVKRCCLIRGAYEAGIVLSRHLEMSDELQKLNAALLAESAPA